MDFHDTCQQLIDRYVACYRNGDAAGCASVFSPAAELYSAFGPPAIGTDAIATLHKDWVAEDGADTKAGTVLSAGHSGALGWCVARMRDGADEGSISMNILARQPDGSWAISHCSLTGD